LLGWGHSQNVVYLWSSDPEGERALALTEAEVALRLTRDDPTAFTAIGLTLSMCSGEQGRAATFVEKALSLDPNNAWAWARSGWIAIYREQPETARKNFEHALALSPFDPLEHNFRAGIAVTNGLEGDFALAAKLTQQMLNKNPQLTWAYRQLASFSALAGDVSTARYAIAKLREAYPGVSIAVMKRSHPLRHSPRLFDVFVEGWRLAGLPEE
jgi:Tfp pilus assembly protein PilF